mgnify:CR=1 FL=1
MKKINVLVVTTILAIGCTALAVLAQAPRQDSPVAQSKGPYKAVSINFHTAQEMEDLLNTMAAQGWSYEETVMGVIAVFRRD